MNAKQLELTEDFKEYMVDYLPENFDHTKRRV